VIPSPSLHHQGPSQLQQLAAATEITLNLRMPLKQEQVKMGNGAKKKKKKKTSVKYSKNV
jgi:hypothetical protein